MKLMSRPVRVYYYTWIAFFFVLFLVWQLVKWPSIGLWWLLKAIGRYLYEQSQQGGGYCENGLAPTAQPGQFKPLPTNPMYDPEKNPWYYYDQTDPAGFARSAAFGRNRDRRG